MLQVVRRVAAVRRERRVEAALDEHRAGVALPSTRWPLLWQRIRASLHLSPLARRTLAAAIASIVLHVLVLMVVGQIPIPESGARFVQDLRAWMTDTPEPEPLQSEPLKIADPSDQPGESVFASQTNSVAPEQADEAELIDIDPAPLLVADVRLPSPDPLMGVELDKMVVNPGAAGDEIDTVEGAVDRITYEIAMNLAQHDVLVVWLMDASISLRNQRDQVADRLQRVYDEIDQLGSVAPGALMSAVVSFGIDGTPLVPPTDDGNEVVAAMRSVPDDETGVENVFSALTASVNQYKPYRTRERRKMMVVIWTDESGDDVDRLEESISVCRRLAVPVYVVGPSSMFGRREGTTAYRHPEDGQVYQLPVDRGPDTVRPELAELPYWFDGPQYKNLRAGVGPYALTRLALETGGAYFINEAEEDRAPFRLADLRDYLPQYVSPGKYMQELKGNRLRQAILTAVDVTRQRPLHGTPRLSFAPTGNNFQQELFDAQKSVADDILMIEQALAPFGPKGLEEEYEKEESPRWRAWYDLTYGRLLALKVRCMEYNWACAVMKGKGADFVDQQSNRWEFRPDEQLNFGSAAERQAAEAKRLLQRCIEQNPGTPWAVLAERELRHPFGIRIDEAYVPPPEMQRMGNNANNPNIPPIGRRVEQPRMLERQPEVNLPKL